MAKKDGLFDEVPDAGPGEGAALGGTHASPEQVPDAPAEAKGGEEAPESDTDRADPANAPARPDGYVPKQSLEEARNELKAERRARRELERKHGALEERTAIILKRLAEEDGQTQRTNGQAPKAKTDGGMPDPDKDIFGAVKHLMRENEQLKGGYGQIQQNTEQTRAAATLRSAYVQDAERFTAEKQDFPDAYAHLMTRYDAELQRLGVTDRAERQARIEAEELRLVALSIQREESPAELAYFLAQQRGYQPKVAPQNGGPDLTRIAKGQEQNRSLSGGAGAPSAGGLTPQALARMSEEEIHRMMKSSRAGYAAVARLTGG